MKPNRILVVASRSLTAVVLPAALLVLACTTAEAGDHHMKVLVGYAPVTPYYPYGYAAAPVAAAPVGYNYPGAAGAPIAGAPSPTGGAFYYGSYYYGVAGGAAGAPPAAGRRRAMPPGPSWRATRRCARRSSTRSPI